MPRTVSLGNGELFLVNAQIHPKMGENDFAPLPRFALGIYVPSRVEKCSHRCQVALSGGL